MSHSECRVCGDEFVRKPSKEKRVCNGCRDLAARCRYYSRQAGERNDFSEESTEELLRKFAYSLGKLDTLEQEIRGRGQEDFLKLVIVGEQPDEIDTTGDTQSQS